MPLSVGSRRPSALASRNTKPWISAPVGGGGGGVGTASHLLISLSGCRSAHIAQCPSSRPRPGSVTPPSHPLSFPFTLRPYPPPPTSALPPTPHRPTQPTM